jgi:hypothetical protein
MPTLIRTWHLANGLKVEILDDTVSYYGDYSTVKLIIRCKVGVKRECLGPFEAHPHYKTITEALGAEAEYVREITKPGVPGKNLAGVKAFLVDKFEENALGYFEREDFPQKFILKKFNEISEKLSGKERPADADR